MHEKSSFDQNRDEKKKLSPEFVRRIGGEYGLENPEYIATVEDGKFNTNFHIRDTVTSREYFLRQHRHSKVVALEQIHAGERFFSSHDISVVTSISLKEDDQHSVYEDRDAMYSMYPWVEGRRYARKELLDAALRSIARMQARMHLLSREGATEGLSERHGIGWSKEKFMAEAAVYERLIQAKEPKEEFDRLALDVLLLQKQLVEANLLQFEDVRLGRDHFIHGDIHPGNMFFDEKDEVKHIVDSEHMQYSARILEVVKSLDYMCGMFDMSDEGLGNIKIFLEEYQKVYPFTREDLELGVRAYIVRLVHYTWPFREHYEKGNSRVDGMFFGLKKKFQFLVRHMDSFIARVAQCYPQS